MTRRLYFGGKILTMDRENPEAEALLTEDGKILAVGSMSELENREAERVDLHGKTMMPAFVDGHSHMCSVGLNLSKYCSLVGASGVEEILERIKVFIEAGNLKNGEAVTCKGYDLAVMKEGRHPTAAELDRLGVDNPIVCIHISGHVAVYNTVAMQKAGVLDEGYACPAGGFAGRDESGRLNGYFEETAKRAFSSVFSTNVEKDERKKAILAAQDYYLKFGYTTVQDGSANTKAALEVLQELAEEGKLKVDIVAYIGASDTDPAVWEKATSWDKGHYRSHLKIGGVKLFLDGSPQVRTAWMRAPYQGETEYRGYPTLTDEELERRMRRAVEYGFQPIAHCNGDAASEQFLSLWEKLWKEDPRRAELRPVMVHAQTVGYDQLARMAKCGMMASFFVGHCFYWGDTHLENFGERGWRISPVGQALAEGVPFNFHQDSPVTPPDMLHSIWCAVNRMTRNGICIGKENRISCYDALAAATRGGAYAYYEENTKGILKAGAVADFVILSEDPTSVPPDRIKDIKVDSTIKDDIVLYQSET